jgi:hypothetical protein
LFEQPSNDHVGVPFEQDGWRDGEHLRPWLTNRFREALASRDVRWTLVTGPPEERLARAVRAAEEALAQHFRYTPPKG